MEVSDDKKKVALHRQKKPNSSTNVEKMNTSEPKHRKDSQSTNEPSKKGIASCCMN